MPKKILIIEDDKLLLELISQRFTKEGYKIAVASDGEEGLKAVKKEMPDLVLLDIILPGMNGFEVLENIKKDPELIKIPVVILSNLWQGSDVKKGLDLGAADYFVKVNFTSEEIIEKIKGFLK